MSIFQCVWNSNCNDFNRRLETVQALGSHPWKEPQMLVLTRKPQQQIQIGNRRITVTVLEVRGGRVRLGIEAPEDVTIRRREIKLPVRIMSREEVLAGI